MATQGPLSGQVLGGKYLLGEVLGKGGFGVVYKAEHQTLGRPQAIKVLLEDHFSDPKFRERFLREARTLAALDHAHIVHVDELGLQDDLVYLVLPYLSGGTLQDALKTQSGSLPLEEIGRYLEHMCSALGYAHAQRVVHLDLKPANLLLHQDGRLLLADFGLAHLVEQGVVAGGTSLQFGSPLYMAPEQFEGKPEARSDLYAVGVILYQLLTGKPPFDAATPAALMRQHLTEPPPPLRQARPDLPAHVEAMLAVALAKQPEQRFQSAAALLVAFKQATAGPAGGPVSGAFVSVAAPTQVPQPLAYDPTLVKPAVPPATPAGAVGPGASPLLSPRAPAMLPGQPAMGPMPWPSGGPLAPPPGYVLMPTPVARPRGQVWTPGFLVAFVVAGAGAVLLTLVSLVSLQGFRGPTAGNFTVSDSAILLLQLGLLGVALVSALLARSPLLRVGCIVLALAAVLSLIESGFDLVVSARQSDAGVPVPFAFFYLPTLAGILTAAGLICLSYGTARWRSPQDLWLSGLHALLTGMALVLLLATAYIAPYSIVALGNEFLFWVTVACMLLSVMIVLARPAAWKQSPLVVAGLGAVAILFLVAHQPDSLALFAPFFRLVLTPASLVQVTIGLYLLPYVLLIPSLLLLSQSERARRQTQSAQPPLPAPALVAERGAQQA